MTIKKNKLTYYFLSILLLTFAFNFYNVYHFTLGTFGERDLLRAVNLNKSFEIYGADLGMQEGRRIPGGFNYYFLWILSSISKNVYFLVYSLLSMIIMSYFYLLKKTLNYLSLNGALIAAIIFFSSNDFLSQTRIFWNPTLGIPFALLSHSFLFKYIESDNKKYLIFSYLNIFLASQFHMSYITLAISFGISLIFIKKQESVKEISFIIIAFIFAYSPFLINFFIPLINENANDYFLINSFLIENTENKNLFIWLFSKIYYAILIKTNSLILLLFFVSLILVLLSLRFFIKKISLQNFIYALIYTSIILVLLYFIYSLEKQVLYLIPLFTFSLICYNILTKKNFLNPVIKKKLINFFNITIIIFICNIILTFVSSYITYGFFRYVIGGRYALFLLPIYSILIGFYYFILIEWLKFSNLRGSKYIKPILNIILSLIIVFNFSYNLKINNKFSTNSFKEMSNIINQIKNKFNLSEFDLVNKVAISRYEDGKILPIKPVALEYYIYNIKNLSKISQNSCFLSITFNKDNNDINKYLNNEDILLSLLKDNQNKFMSDFSLVKIYQTKNMFLIKYKTKNNDCPKNITNDYILNDYEKNISKFLLNKKENTSYKVKDKYYTKYYIKINKQKLNYPLNTLLEFRIKDNILEINFFSKRLRNDNSLLNGYWSAVTLENPEIIFVNNIDGKKYKFAIIKGTIGKDFLQTPWKSKFNTIPKGSYTIWFNGYKLQEKYSSLIPINLQYKLDKNFIYE